MNIRQAFTPLALVACIAAFAAPAMAQSVTVKCSVSDTRSKAEVEGYGLVPGWYSSVLLSGANQAESKADHADRDDDDDGPRDEDVDFEFDSKRSEWRDGDTRIAKNFIVDGMVTAILRDASGVELARSTAKCRQR